MGKTLKSRNLIAELEDEIRHAATNPSVLRASGRINQALGNCLANNGTPCKVTKTDFDLLYKTGSGLKVLTGGYNAQGESCSGVADCPIEIKTWFLPQCPGGQARVCEVAASFVISYSIYVNHLLDAKEHPPIRSGAIVFVNHDAVQPRRRRGAPLVANLTCPDDGGHAISFIQMVDVNKPDHKCLEAPLPSATLTGFKHGTCRNGVLQGFRANGRPICGLLKGGG
jgi:hypothetical protein